MTLEQGDKKREHQDIILYWMELYHQKIGAPYLFQRAKDATIVSRLLKVYGYDRLKRLMDQMFITSDPFICKRAGRTLGVLSACANKLSQEIAALATDRLSDAGRTTAMNAKKVWEKFHNGQDEENP